MKKREFREILTQFPDMNIKSFLELATRHLICTCERKGGWHSPSCLSVKQAKVKLHMHKVTKIFPRVYETCGDGHEDTLDVIPDMVKNLDAPTFFFLNVEKIGSKDADGFLPIRPVREELDLILKNYNHPGIFCLTDFESWPEYPKWTAAISPEIILKIFQKRHKKVVAHFPKNNHFIIVIS